MKQLPTLQNDIHSFLSLVLVLKSDRRRLEDRQIPQLFTPNAGRWGVKCEYSGCCFNKSRLYLKHFHSTSPMADEIMEAFKMFSLMMPVITRATGKHMRNMA